MTMSRRLSRQHPRIKAAGARALGFDLCGVAPAADHPELAVPAANGWTAATPRDDDLPASHRPTPRRRPPRRAVRRRPSSSPAPCTTPIGRTRPSAPIAAARRSRALRVGRRLPRRDRRADGLAAAPGCASDRRRPSRRAPTSTPGRCRSASTRSMPASAGSARTRASSTRSSDPGCFSAAIICSLPLEVDAPSLDQCGSCTLCHRGVPDAGASSRRACSTRRAASRT